MKTAVGRFSSRAEAEMARSLLASADIDASIRADDAGALHPELAQVGERHGIALLVDAAHAADAQQLLDAVARGTFATPASDEQVTADGAATSGRRRGTLVVAVLVLFAIATSLWTANLFDVFR